MNEWVSVDEGLSLTETRSGYFSYCIRQKVLLGLTVGD